MSFGLQVLAGIVWNWSFVKDSQGIAAHGYGGFAYSWLIFAAGLGIGPAGFHAARPSPRRSAGAA